MTAAFHHLPARELAAIDHPVESDVLICSDHESAVKVTSDIVGKVPNMRPLNAGELAMATPIESFTAVREPLAIHDLPLDVAGTAFQQAVWQELRRIPPGETRSYAQIAAAVGKPGAVRAAGSANGANHVAVLIPCHRVVRSDGSLGGYAGGLERKRRLLAAEGHRPAAPELPLAE